MDSDLGFSSHLRRCHAADGGAAEGGTRSHHRPDAHGTYHANVQAQHDLPGFGGCVGRGSAVRGLQIRSRGSRLRVFRLRLRVKG
jgi:hypothetical protein